MIETGVLKENDRLPPTRELAFKLEVRLTTVARAYEELWSLGYIEGRQGAHTRVRIRAELAGSRANLPREPLLDWDETVSPGLKGMINKMQIQESESGSKKIIDLATLSPDPRLWPIDEFRKCLNKTILQYSSELFDYDIPQGNLELRKTMSKYLGRHQIQVSIEELLITNGAQGALDLLFRSLAGPGRTIISANPT